MACPITQGDHNQWLTRDNSSVITKIDGELFIIKHDRRTERVWDDQLSRL